MLKSLIIAALMIVVPCVAVHAQQHGMKTVGRASYYHDSLHGLRMANGRPYHRDSLTCAHLRFPLGTMLRVTNVYTGKSIEVEVTDRGPYSRRFIVDLSRRAARELGIIGSRHIDVTLTPVGDIHIPFRVTKMKAEQDSIASLYDMPLFSEQDGYTWDGDSILQRALDDLQKLRPQ